MPRGYWLFVVTALGCLTLSAFLAWSLYPQQPYLSGNSSYEEQQPGYSTGGRDCQPTIIAALPDRERFRRAQTCNEAKEQHRLQANDLIQQRRAADAADESAVYAYQQTRIAAWGTALGFVTMVAAIAAAFYARMAAMHSAEAHNAFIAAERPIIRMCPPTQG